MLTRIVGHLSPSTESLVKIGILPALDEIEARRLENSSPGTTMSAPDPPASFNFYTPCSSLLSPVTQSVDASPPSLHLDPSRSHPSSYQSRPKLAPPADIIGSGGSSRRRRPNPNEPISSLHRRHRSQQEFGVSRPVTHSEKVLVPGTPPLRPSPTAPYNDAGSHARSSAMEQDAIETLLFMSSPGHSGYHSSSQHSQRHQNVLRSIDSIGSDVRVPPSQDSHASSYRDRGVRGSHGQDLGLEAQAGDAIDLMLDQMDSDSDDGIKYASNSSRQDSSERTKMETVRGR
ncbi:hypothetical protein BO94DRAFT_38252 [Aspergillus sclerotioniger CBS 115572]|uniref:Uncharacterized protein n=1 Tax=Aspergillus sclerotioniger CBS 115572 TaxID=1450535 RepID=A0A317WWE1_9EURO|nr:hypothetical protein BO94DRAFT_38252 [Aspergillus sclerotioniger CBS 115572]PWY89497.1 hypothetical protein BO94DRAFT_38252 [Aspergillus sclerotioniger CBS 115572]